MYVSTFTRFVLLFFTSQSTRSLISSEELRLAVTFLFPLVPEVIAYQKGIVPLNPGIRKHSHTITSVIKT